MDPQPPQPAEPPSRRATILIAGGGTGGHLMPALAIAEGLRQRRPDLEPVLVGAERGLEATLLPSRGVRYHLLSVEPLYRRQWWKNVRWPMLALRVRRQVNELLDSERPLAVLGTGGYASGPVVWFAAQRRIPTAIQEQNAFPGFATRSLSRRVRQIYLGLPEARERLKLGPQTQVFDTGNPITPPDPSRREAAARRLGVQPGKPVLLVTGGSQGSLAINGIVAAWIESGAAREFTVLWATGRGSYEQFAPLQAPPGVKVFDFLYPMADAYSVADLVVARAGMMTGAELCAWGLPSVLIPLPTAAADHQTANAQALVSAGAARMLAQRDLTVASFAQTVGALLHDPGRRRQMAEAALARGRPHALDTILSHLLTLF